jgi:hypothetical protein
MNPLTDPRDIASIETLAADPAARAHGDIVLPSGRLLTADEVNDQLAAARRRAAYVGVES